MKEGLYNVNTSPFSELPSKIAKIQHLKSHSEKKALAILLKDTSVEHDIITN